MARASSIEQGLAPQGTMRLQVPVRQTNGMRWQEKAHISKDLHHRDGRRGACHTGVQSQSERQVVRDGKDEVTRARTSLDHMDTMKFWRKELFRAASGPWGMLPPGTKSWHLQGMSHPGTAGSGEARSWRGNVVRSGAMMILNNLAQSSLVIYRSELKELHCQHLKAEQWIHMRAELVVWETSGLHRCCVIPKKRWKRQFVL